MKKLTIAIRLTTFLFVLLLSVSPLAAQKKRGTTPRKPLPAQTPTQPAQATPTFDTLLADDSYKVYAEVRGVGQFIRSPAVNDLIPLLKFGGSPKEFRTVLKWLDAHADVLAGSRMMVASWPTKTDLPAVLMAIEFSSPEDAQKFEPELRRFIPIIAPPPVPAPASSSGQPASISSPSPGPANVSNNPSIPYHITHVGTLVLLSDKAFAFRDLKPRHAKLLAENSNFSSARNRFSSESVFVFVDVKAIEKEDLERRKKMEEAEKRRIEEEAKQPKPEALPEVDEFKSVAIPNESIAIGPTPPEPNEEAILTTSEPTWRGAVNPQDAITSTSQDSQLVNTLMFSLYGAFFTGQTKWPEGVAAGVAFEGDAYVARVLILSSAENKALAVPFFPQFISGPPLAPQGPSILPSDSDLFISASLDYSQMYDQLLKTISNLNERSRNPSVQIVSSGPPVSPFAEYEKKLGLKIKDDLLPLLGNEISVALLPKSANDKSTNESTAPADKNPPKTTSPDPDPVIAIALKDKDAVSRLLPKIIETLAGKSANLFSQTERKDDTEITTYGNLLSYAFVGNFLIISPTSDATKRAVASYLNGETLSANSHFRNASRWQSRETLAQVYMAPALIARWGWAGNPANPGNEKMAELLSRLNPNVEPLTYSISNEGSGPLHELHVPRNLMLLMVAGMTNDATAAPLNTNETIAKSNLRTLVSAEEAFKATTGNGRYGTLDELLKAGMISKDMLDQYGYKIVLSVSGNEFEATAVPLEYGKTGKLSYFVDKSSVLRGGDHGGSPATISDPPVQ
ncbi:MAG: DUF3352 domain-containing protein [Pyrinomonadaceae bacterium]